MITVYSKPACVQCTATKRFLTQKGAEFIEIDVTEDDEAMALIKEQGFLQAPVVNWKDRWWSGFDPDKLTEALE